MTAFVANTNNLTLQGLKDALSGAFINDATVTVTVKTAAGVDLGGASWPMTMDYVSASDGDYRAVLSAALPFLNGKHYVAYIEAQAGGSPPRVGNWVMKFKAEVRD